MDTTPRLLQAGPFRFGFIAATGVLLALALGFAVASLAQALTLIFLALFISLGLKPIVWRLERRGMSKVVALLIVLAGFLLLVAVLLWLVVPVVVDELGKLIAYLPDGLDNIEHQDWFIALNESFGGALTGFVELLQQTLADPNFWVTVGGGALRVGMGVVNGVFSVIFVVALTLYFVIGHDQMKDALVRLVPASRRVGFREIAEQIITSVGKYLNGMVILAIMNALFTFIVLTAVGVRRDGDLRARRRIRGAAGCAGGAERSQLRERQQPEALRLPAAERAPPHLHHEPLLRADESTQLAILTAAARGVDVELFVSEIGDQFMVHHAQRSYYAALLEAGVRIHLYPPPTVLHSKHFSIDEEIAVIGTSNMDIRSFSLNMEVSLLVHGRGFVDELRAVEDAYRETSRELTLEEWTRRPMRARVFDALMRLTSSLQ